MSAPNKSYDPVEVAALSPDEVQRVLDEALAAIAAAGNFDELKAARLAHAGDRAPITLANAEIGALPPAARAEAGKRVGTARAAIRAAPTRWPASALACGGSAPISALASASGDRSPAWASRAALSSSSVRAAAMAASASFSAAATSSGDNAVTSTGS